VLLEKLLDHLSLRVRPFALCDVKRGTHLRLPPPESAAMHFVLEGRGELTAAPDLRLPVGHGTLVVIPPGLAHTIESGPLARELEVRSADLPRDHTIARVVSEGRTPGLIFACGAIEAAGLSGRGLFDNLRWPLVEDFSDMPEVEAIFARLMDEQAKPGPGSQAMLTALMTQCLVILLRRICGAPQCSLPWLNALEDERLSRALDLIVDAPERPHTLETLAAEAGMSRSSFAEKFADAFGRSAMEFLREARLRRAAALLRTTDLPVKLVASRVGFSSRSHFSSAFAVEFGVSPAAYRGA